MTRSSSFAVLGVMLLAALYSATHGSSPWLFALLVLAGLLDMLVLRFAVSLWVAARRARTHQSAAQHFQTRSAERRVSKLSAVQQ